MTRPKDYVACAREHLYPGLMLFPAGMVQSPMSSGQNPDSDGRGGYGEGSNRSFRSPFCSRTLRQSATFATAEHQAGGTGMTGSGPEAVISRPQLANMSLFACLTPIPGGGAVC